MRKSFFLIITFYIFLVACKVSKHSPITDYRPYLEMDTVEIKESSELPPYQPSRKKYFDLIHTKLEINFDWGKKHLHGKATLSLHPYFYSSSTLVLDAKGFDIHKIELIKENEHYPLSFQYNDTMLSIQLDKNYVLTDTFFVSIEYTAQPYKLSKGGGESIRSERGLYFINADLSEKNKPQQIWTQGEVDANSCWFPTIDAPNEKMTQEFYITVNEKFVTLSNGILMYSSLNGDGTRTDYWKQSLPHSPYLAVIVIGEYAIVKDYWKGIEVDYYVEPKYKPYAEKIFEHTTEMLDFFSNKLNVKYPWEKFSQVIVRDFVSGAMENTTVVVHGAFVQKTTRELLDEPNDDIVAHEMFHHWFGDYVTCESWANLPLNESFATYGEYLWREYKYGVEDADDHLKQDFDRYLRESKTKQVNLIRYHYTNPNHLFDRHSYEKGGSILHLLRKYLGDDAFFASLTLYLTKHQWGTAEIHDLRMAFEEITGDDLNWFFNQWFLSSGHPDLLIQYEYIDSLKKQKVIIEQKQNLKTTPIYKLPMAIDIYFDTNVVRHYVVVEKEKEILYFNAPTLPLLVNVDAEKIIPCVKTDKKFKQQWLYQYYHAPHFLDRYESIKQAVVNAWNDTLTDKMMLDALNDSFWSIRLFVLNNLGELVSKYENTIQQKLILLAKEDISSSVKATAIKQLSRYFPRENNELKIIYKNAIRDSAYSVVTEGLLAIVRVDSSAGMREARHFENETSTDMIFTILSIYSKYGSDRENKFFLKKANELKGFDKYDFLQEYSDFLKNKEDETINTSLPVFEDAVRNENRWIVKWGGMKALEKLLEQYTKQENDLSKKLTQSIAANELSKNDLESKIEKISNQKNKIASLIEELKKDPSYKKVLNMEDE